jgi:hypothetical protein
MPSFVASADERVALDAALADERAVLEAAFADVGAGRPGIVHVEGGAGVGKTALVERFLRASEDRPGTVVLRGRCYSRESVSYNGFDGVLDELSEWMSQLDSSALSQVLPADVGSLRVAFPIFRRVGGIGASPDVPYTDFLALHDRAFRALRELFANIADRYTLIVALDDAHSGGPDTALLIGEVFHPPGPPRLLLILVYRSEDAARSTLFEVLHQRAATLLAPTHRVVLRRVDVVSSQQHREPVEWPLRSESSAPAFST